MAAHACRMKPQSFAMTPRWSGPVSLPCHSPPCSLRCSRTSLLSVRGPCQAYFCPRVLTLAVTSDSKALKSIFPGPSTAHSLGFSSKVTFFQRLHRSPHPTAQALRARPFSGHFPSLFSVLLPVFTSWNLSYLCLLSCLLIYHLSHLSYTTP